MDPLLTGEEAQSSCRSDHLTDKEIVLAKVKSLLNCLTPWNFENVKDQLVQTIGGALSVSVFEFLVSCIFDMAISEDAFVLFGRLCAELSFELPDIPSDECFREVMTFRRLLLNKCQTEFENATRETNISLMAHADEKLRVRLVGTVRLVAELFKWKLITEMICHSIIQKLINCPLERNIQAVCQFVSSMGKQVDTSTKSRQLFDLYFRKLEELSQNPQLTQRSRDMIFDLQHLRANNWVKAKTSPRFSPWADKYEELSSCAAAMTSRCASDNYIARGLKPDLSEKGDYLLATQAVEKFDDNVHQQLGKALEEIKISKQQACEEHVPRIVAEKETREAIHKAGPLESKYNYELRLRKETEDTLAREREELEKMKLLLETYQKERDNALKITEDLLKNQAEETSLRSFCYSEEHKTPSCFFCPISQEVMKDPHVAADGFTYEGEAIRKWVDSGHDASPMTNLKLSHLALVPDHALRSAIREWQQQHQQR